MAVREADEDDALDDDVDAVDEEKVFITGWFIKHRPLVG